MEKFSYHVFFEIKKYFSLKQKILHFEISKVLLYIFGEISEFGRQIFYENLKKKSYKQVKVAGGLIFTFLFVSYRGEWQLPGTFFGMEKCCS